MRSDRIVLVLISGGFIMLRQEQGTLTCIMLISGYVSFYTIYAMPICKQFILILWNALHIHAYTGFLNQYNMQHSKDFCLTKYRQRKQKETYCSVFTLEIELHKIQF